MTRPTAAKPQPVAYSYVRFSTPEQAEGDSLRRQTEAAAGWCQRNGVKLDTTKSFRDLGKSAFLGGHRKNPDRNALAAFLKLVEAGQIPRGSILIVESLDRLTREDIRPALTLVLNLIEAGVEIVQLSPVEARYGESVEPMSLMMAIMELSRGHAESKRKSDLIRPAWVRKREAARQGLEQPARKTSPVSGTMILTHRLPGWVRERGGKPVLIPERATVVRRVFNLAADGYGSKLIAKQLIKEGVSGFGPSGEWNATYVSAILRDRRALGEFQPHRRCLQPAARRQERAGDPIPNYFPAAVTEAEFLAARAGAAARRGRPGRVGAKVVNVFAGVLSDAVTGSSYHIREARPSKGRGYFRHVLINTAGTEGRERMQTFPYSVFEQAVLGGLREIDATEILPAQDAVADPTAELAVELAGVEAELTSATEWMMSHGFSATIGNRVQTLEATKADLEARLAAARTQAAFPPDADWESVGSLVEVLRTAEEPNSVRLKLRSVLRRVVDEIKVVIAARGRDRLALVQVNFKGTNAVRKFRIVHRPPQHDGRRSTIPGRYFVLSIRHPDDGLWPIENDDLRDPTEAACARSSLEDTPRPVLTRLLSRGVVLPGTNAGRQ